ncbi:hypothetical protein CLM85_32305 [Streptomyces albidoflavus]|uniref:GIY-YIG nuclease family protein n=1 Tax=Streptomyces albidoflavus TaxID=1886 RepID=UPI000BAE331C|nr:GIY-YIG nuclease family protein [Streptomyces albidoflavus]PAX89587.1 hypothetical protein CLM82_20400 [Streptomyces albidoflavus]PBO18779.1 hypothetical protein CLM83_10295 [Streptomyces albidoflavus]PBO20779.1 hypothetical protein CLM85_32305 [Streptomyces albidoflavus]PBO29756.1 hypothetical protein CLM84_12290 [Streptomyces albidoflavus]
MTLPIKTESGLLAEWRKPSPETAVYRIYNSADELLYVGITNDLIVRWTGHRSDKPWWRTEAHRYEVAWFPNRSAAAAEEKQAILKEAPRYNSLYRHPPLRPVEQLHPGTYSVKEIAQRFRLSPKTVRELATADAFPRRVANLPRYWGARYPEVEVEEYFTQRQPISSPARDKEMPA